MGNASPLPPTHTPPGVDAILNDTTGCLIACAYKRPNCAIGVILGTGTNASYLETPDLVNT